MNKGPMKNYNPNSAFSKNIPEITPTEMQTALAESYTGRVRAIKELEEHKYDRAVRLFSARTVKKLSQEKYAELLGIGKSTLNDWERPRELGSREAWDIACAKYGETNVYRQLRAGKNIADLKNSNHGNNNDVKSDDLLTFLADSISTAECFIRVKAFNSDTLARADELLAQLQNQLNRLQSLLDKEKNRK